MKILTLVRTCHATADRRASLTKLINQTDLKGQWAWLKQPKEARQHDWWRNIWSALCAVAGGFTHVLLCEDDVRFAKGVRTALHAMPEQAKTGVVFVTVADGVLSDGNRLGFDQGGWYRAARHLHNAGAVLINLDWLRRVIHKVDQSTEVSEGWPLIACTDIFISQLAWDNGERVRLPKPCPAYVDPEIESVQGFDSPVTSRHYADIWDRREELEAGVDEIKGAARMVQAYLDQAP